MFIRLFVATLLTITLPLVTFVPYLLGTNYTERVLYGFDAVRDGSPNELDVPGTEGGPSASCRRREPGSTALDSVHVFECVITYEGLVSALSDVPRFPLADAASSFQMHVEHPPIPEGFLRSAPEWMLVLQPAVVLLVALMLVSGGFGHRADLLRARAALRREPWWLLPPLVVAMVGSPLVLWFYPDVLMTYDLSGSVRGVILAMGFAVIGPIGEELLFRGWMLRYFDAVMSPRLALLATSGLFAASHLPAHPVLGAYFVAMGLSFGWIRRRTGSVWFAALAHVLVNATPWLLAPLMD